MLSASVMQRGVHMRRCGLSAAAKGPAARCAGSARPSRTPVRTFAQAPDSSVGDKTLKQKAIEVGQKVYDKFADVVSPEIARRLDPFENAPEKVSTLPPKDIRRCIEHAVWAWSAYNTDTRTALASLSTESSIKAKLIPDSLVLLSGSSKLSSGFMFSNFETDTQALVGLQHDGNGGVELVVAFRGSEPKADDWMTDFYDELDPASKLVEELDTKYQIHAGFLKSANDLLKEDTTLLYGHRDATEQDRADVVGPNDLEPRQQRLVDGRAELEGGRLKRVPSLKALADILLEGRRLTKVIMCGHSLGGALATLAAYWARKDKGGWPDVPVDYYSYGAPRVANAAFADEWDATLITSQHEANVFRITHNRDLVPAVPHIGPNLEERRMDGYKHVSKSVLLLQPGKDAMPNYLKNPKKWPALDNDEAWQAQLRTRPYHLENTSAEDHSLYQVNKDPKTGVRTEVGYIPALEDALKNSTTEPLNG